MSEIPADLIQSLNINLNLIAKVFGYQLISTDLWSEKSNGEKIIFLHNFGFSSSDIASIVGTTINTVRKEISNRKEK